MIIIEKTVMDICYYYYGAATDQQIINAFIDEFGSTIMDIDITDVVMIGKKEDENQVICYKLRVFA